VSTRLLGEPRTARDELAEDTAYGELYLSRLRRMQLELSLFGLGVFGGLVGSLPLLFALVPNLPHVQPLGIPLSALLVCGVPCPLVVLIGVVYQRRADALDAAFRELVREG
jgi:hypothetical protein